MWAKRAELRRIQLNVQGQQLSRLLAVEPPRPRPRLHRRILSRILKRAKLA